MKRAGSHASAVEAVDEAVHVLRRTPAALWLWYYAGTLPFLLALVAMLGAVGADSIVDSLRVAALFLWMSLAQSIFASRLRDVIAGEPVRTAFIKASLRRAYCMALVQSTKLFAIPLALLATLPFAWSIAFYGSFSALPDSDLESLAGSLRRAGTLAKLEPKQNWLILGVLLLFAIVVFLNVALALAIAPQLLKTLLGIESSFTSAGLYALRNSTFLFAALAIAYAILDPLLKAIYAVRCFHGESRRTGADLRAKWSSIRAAAGALILIFLMQPAFGQQAVSAPELKASVERVLQNPQYQWTTHRPEREALQTLQRATKWLVDRIDDILSMLFPTQKEGAPADTGRKPKASSLRALTWGLVGAAALLVASILWRNRRSKQPAPLLVQAATPVIDPADSNVTADQLPEDEWAARAREAAAGGDVRMAVRLLYLGMLSALGGRGVIALRRGKSNLDYARELRRRARQKTDLIAAFEVNLGIFESSWYGLHSVTDDSLAECQANFERIRRNEI